MKILPWPCRHPAHAPWQHLHKLCRLPPSAVPPPPAPPLPHLHQQPIVHLVIQAGNPLWASPRRAWSPSPRRRRLPFLPTAARAALRRALASSLTCSDPTGSCMPTPRPLVPLHCSAWARAPWPVALRAAALPQGPLLPVTVLSPKGRAVFSVYHLCDFNWVLLVNLPSALDIFFMQIHSYYVYVNELCIPVSQDLLWDTWVTRDSQVGTHIC